MVLAKSCGIVAAMTEAFISNGNPPEVQTVQDPLDDRARILVVEDEQDLRQLTADVLMDAGYRVDVAADGAAAWSALQRSKYDLLFTDQFLPKVSGAELLRKIHAAQMILPVIMATGYLPNWEFALHTWLQPAKMLGKPYSYEKLLATVKNVLPQNNPAGANLPSGTPASEITGLPLIAPVFTTDRLVRDALN
jgi:DNA-binding response OmpR family regulator